MESAHKNTKSELASLAPAEVVPINYSDSEATVYGKDGSGNNAIVQVTIPPAHISNPLLKLYIGYLQSPLFLGLSPSTRYTKAIEFRNFYKYIAENKQYESSGLPYDIVNQYFIKLKETSERTSFYNEEIILRVPLKLFSKTVVDGFDKDKFAHVSLANYLVFFPNFPPPHSLPKKSMAELFGQKNTPYSDTELMQSLRLGCCFLLNKLSEIREKLMSNKHVLKQINALKTAEYDNKPLIFNSQSNNFTVDYAPPKQIDNLSWEIIKTANLQIYETIVNNADPLTLEIFTFRSFPKAKLNSIEAKLTTLQWVQEFKNNLQTTASIYKKRTYGKNSYFLRRLDNITPKFLICPSDFEIYLIQCLLASESIQREGLNIHLLSDFSINFESAQIQYNKGRRDKSSATPIYTRQNLPYQCYTRYIEQRKVAKEYSLADTNKTLDYSTVTTAKGHIGFTAKSLHLFELLLSNESEVTRQYKDELGSEGDAFLWLIKRMWQHNQIAYNETIANSRNKKKLNELTGASKRESRVIGLTPDAITMSRKRMDDTVTISKKEGPETARSQSEPAVQAELTSHSLATKHNVYGNRSNSKEAIESERNFGAQVGDLMVEDALKVGEYLKDMKQINLSEIKDLLGLTSGYEDIEQLLENVDAELWGGFQHNGQVIILISDVTAMLLTGYINHLHDEIPRLFLDSQLKGQYAQKKLAYLSTIFNSFPPDIQREGKKLLEEFDIPFPSLV